MTDSQAQPTLTDYKVFKDRYLSQFSQETLEYLGTLETKEPWAIYVQMERIVETFNMLPAICNNPLEERDLELISKLIRLVAYLPFRESMTALAWLGFENEEYGYAIYRIAYDCYNDNSAEYANAHIIIERTKVMARIAMLHQIMGVKA
ncbi:hypothetical protein [Vibrio agarivorans]|uniref:hypothetical protein n=1 Tax=Vibrio agarivorans TaxID=153622 RepID=UPI0025B46317|nr:hypothetical protein [Vibrio agarivorans]MDN3661095.1 hypothetical protein [Vibrio agarivorans]